MAIWRRPRIIPHTALFWCCLFAVMTEAGGRSLTPSLFADDSDKPASQAESPAKPAAPSDVPLFESHVAPIFAAKCTRCHGTKLQKAGLDLSQLAGVFKGSESGEVVSRGKVEDSLLFDMIVGNDMPPDEKDALSKSQIETIRLWIETGARSQHGESQVASISQHDVLPILYLRCTACHGLRTQEGGLDLRTKAALLKGGKSGPAIVLGSPEDSLVLKRIHAEEMPPRRLLIDAGVRPMTEPEIDLLTKWIELGAPEIDIQPDVATTEPDPLVTAADREFWSFQPPKRADIPDVKHTDRVNTPIDAFVLSRLEAQGLTLSPEADRFTLIRRVAFDLTGLPPTWQEVEEYLADDGPDAYRKMVDRYLQSPHYGERWGRYWLDIAGYADSEGKRSADPLRPFAWRYRDYVVRAFNNDKPYDRFLLEQLAGDELADCENAPEMTQELMDNLIATGFLRMAPDGTGSDIVDTVAERFEVVADELEVLGSSVLGLTIKCAQCHSHKYDPIPQRDYYRLMAIFKGAYDEHDWLKPSFVPSQTKSAKPGRVLNYVTQAEMDAWQAAKRPIEEKIAALESAVEQKQNELVEEAVAKELAKLPEQLYADLRTMLKTPTKQRDEVQQYLAAKFEKSLVVDVAALAKQNTELRKLIASTKKQVKALQAKIPPEPGIRALWDRGTPSPTYVYRRGEYTNPGDLVGPGVPSVLTDGQTPFEVKPPWPGAKKTGRRLAFAKWLTQPNHPLTARVMVNRIWNHHFGRGIVKSLSNFGRTGTAPTHPQLLDWLACEFVDRGWSMKELHRLIMNSSVYRQSSQLTSQLEEADPANDYFSRMPLRRMEAEVIRDSVLAVSDQLHDKPFGEPDDVEVRADGLVTSLGTEQGWRRSIYVRQRRKEMPTILENFDLPQMIPNCVDRPDSTVASQALHLMNNAMIRQLADDFAERVYTEVGDDSYQQVERVYQIALNRQPDENERRLGEATLAKLSATWARHLASQANAGDKTPVPTDKVPEDTTPADKAAIKALGSFCHSIINSAGFLYID